MNPTKPWYQSTTIWANAAAFAVEAYNLWQPYIPEKYGHYVALGIATFNALWRFNSKTKLTSS